jgi:hypothetical protein
MGFEWRVVAEMDGVRTGGLEVSGEIGSEFGVKGRNTLVDIEIFREIGVLVSSLSMNMKLQVAARRFQFNLQ